MTQMKIVKTGAEAREALIRGVNALADAVKLTLGPSGYNAVLGPKGGALTRVTNDGITIAREIECEDEIENLGLKTALEACSQTNELAGDGTTTSVVLLQALTKTLKELFGGTGNVVGSRKSISEVRQMVATELELVVNKLKEMARPVASKEGLIQVAKISVEDDALAELIGSAQWELGKDGTIIPEVSNEREDSIERVNGIRIDNGFGTSLAINNQEKQTLEVQDYYVILTNHTLQNLSALVGNDAHPGVLVQLVKLGKKNVIIIARGFTEQAIQECQGNQKMGNSFIPINAPYTNQSEVMKDLSAALGGRYVNSESSRLEDMQLSDIGFAKSVVAGRWSAIFTRAKDEEGDARIAERLNELEMQLTGSPSVFEKKMIEDRVAQLKNGFAIMKVTGTTLIDRNYKKDKVDDCVNAVKAALQEGTIDGGGVALSSIADSLPDDSLLKQALLAPYNQIQENSGGLEIDSDFIRDPVKVTRIALEKAVSVGTQLATAGIAIAEKRKKEKKDEND